MRNVWWPWCSCDHLQSQQMTLPSSSQKNRTFSPWHRQISLLLLQVHLNLPEPLHYAGQVPMRPQVHTWFWIQGTFSPLLGQSRTPCCLQCCRLDRSYGHSQGSRVLSEAPGKWGRWTSPVSSLIFLKPWQLVPSSYLSWILRILLFTNLCIIGKDKRDRVKKGRNT